MIRQLNQKRVVENSILISCLLCRSGKNVLAAQYSLEIICHAQNIVDKAPYRRTVQLIFL